MLQLEHEYEQVMFEYMFLYLKLEFFLEPKLNPCPVCQCGTTTSSGFVGIILSFPQHGDLYYQNRAKREGPKGPLT